MGELNEELYEEIKAIIVEILAVDESVITPTAKFREDLGADSLDLVELIMMFEERFGGRISDDDARSITSVEQAVEYIGSRMQAEA